MPVQRSLIPAMLAAMLLLGQWLGMAHDPDHGPQPGAAHACVVCVHLHGGAGLLPAALILVFATGHEAPPSHAPAYPLAVTQHRHPIRGPPALLV